MPDLPSNRPAQATKAQAPSDTQPLSVPEELRMVARGADTGRFSSREIQARLGAGRTEVDRTGEGSTLRVAHMNEPPQDRRDPYRTGGLPPGATERRTFIPLNLPTLFPPQGTVQLLVVGGFADDRAMGEEIPFWRDDDEGGSLLWRALARAGLVGQLGRSMALGQGGFWEETPPETRGLAMTYMGFRRRGELADFEQVIKPWNLRRLQILIGECDERSGGRLKVITLGDAARFMVCATLFALPGIPLLSLPDPGRSGTARSGRPEAESRDRWVEWATEVMSVGVLPD